MGYSLLISERALAANIRAHERTEPVGLHQLPYGAFGNRWRDWVLRIAHENGGKSILDYGAGKGLLAEAIGEALPVQSYDPATFPEPPRPADIVVCTDVLIFVEPEYLRPVIADIRRLARKAAFIIVPRHSDEKLNTPEAHAQPHAFWEPAEWQEVLAETFPHHHAETINAVTRRMVFTGWVDR